MDANRERPEVMAKMLEDAGRLPVALQRALVSFAELANRLPAHLDRLYPAARQLFGGGRLAVGRVPSRDERRPGIWARTYFHHADGAWLVLYAWLRFEAGLAAPAAFDEAVRRSTGARNHADLGDLASPPIG